MMAWDRIPGGSDLLRLLGPEPSFGDAAIVSLELASETCRLLVETVPSAKAPRVRVAFELTGLIALSLERPRGPTFSMGLRSASCQGAPSLTIRAPVG